MVLLERTEHITYCPYKGDCSYFSIPHGGDRSVNAVWTYEAPYAAVTLIKDYLAFYPDRVDAIEERHGEYRPLHLNIPELPLHEGNPPAHSRRSRRPGRPAQARQTGP
jgi:Domain of unknown function (DUF427)